MGEYTKIIISPRALFVIKLFSDTNQDKGTKISIIILKNEAATVQPCSLSLLHVHSPLTPLIPEDRALYRMRNGLRIREDIGFPYKSWNSHPLKIIVG
jgi:hypothetical protein